MKKLIAIDLDGTTLSNHSTISKQTETVLQKLVAKGHYVSIATGRPYRMSKNFYQQLKLTTPMVNFNGAWVHIPETHWEKEKETGVEREIVFDILAQKQALSLDFIAVENKTTFLIDSFENFDTTFFASEASDRNLLTTKNLITNANSMMVRTKAEQAKNVSDALKSQYGDVIEVNTWGGPTPILEIVSKGTHKASGLETIADYFNIKQKDILAFGDEHNDEEMLQYAGWGVAMKNGTDKLKSIANDVTEKTNDEDGLADYLSKYFHLSE